MTKRVVAIATMLLLVVFIMSTLVIGCAPKGPAYPVQAITFTVPYAAGGPSDLGARAYADALKTILPQPITVVNKGGASTVPAVFDVVSAKPDGYNLLWGATTSFTTVPQLSPADVPYKGVDAAYPVITLAYVPNVFCVGADQPWKTMKDLITYAKANPEKVRIAPTGLGSGPDVHLSHVELLAGVKFTHVYTTGAAPSVTAVLGNQVEGTVLNTTPVMPQIAAGKTPTAGSFRRQETRYLS